jgi:hypothetical protein
MQEETNSILNQRTQNVWNKKSIYAINLLPKRMKYYEMPCSSGTCGRRTGRKFRRWVVCVCVLFLAVMRIRFPVSSGGA